MITADLVICNNGKATTTSIKVAEYFGKQHKNVIQTIENLLEDCDVANRLNFKPRDYTDNRGKTWPMYELDRDGFTLLAMGFTGRQALQFKLSYIDAFNKAEQALKTSIPTIHDPQTRAIMLLLAETDAVKHQQSIMTEQIQTVNIDIAETRNDVAQLKEHIKLEPWQAHNLQKAVARKVELWKELYPTLNSKKAFPALYRHLKEKFQVATYTQIAAVRYEEAMTVITKLNMSGLAGL